MAEIVPDYLRGESRKMRKYLSDAEHATAAARDTVDLNEVRRQIGLAFSLLRKADFCAVRLSRGLDPESGIVVQDGEESQ